MILLKNIYDEDFLINLAKEISKNDIDFDRKNFVKSLLEDNWKDKELKERMRTIAISIDSYLTPDSLEKKINILKKTAISIEKDKNSGLSL